MHALEQPSPPDDVQYFSADDLARRYKIHRITVFVWARKGLLPKGELVGPNTRRWRSDQLEAFELLRLESQATK